MIAGSCANFFVIPAQGKSNLTTDTPGSTKRTEFITAATKYIKAVIPASKARRESFW
jgi:hypothetical protein